MKSIFLIMSLITSSLVYAQTVFYDGGVENLSQAIQEKIKEAAMQLIQECGVAKVAEMLEQKKKLPFSKPEVSIEEIEKELNDLNTIDLPYIIIGYKLIIYCAREKLVELHQQGIKTVNRKDINQYFQNVGKALDAQLTLLSV